MRNVLFLGLFSLLFSFASADLGDDKTAIKKVLTKFTKAGDSNDAKALDLLLNEHYRITMNQLFGSKDIAVMDKSTYLDMIRSKKFGGDKRRIDIQSINIQGNNAVVHVHFLGEKANFNSILGFAKTAEGNWQLISDTVAPM